MPNRLSGKTVLVVGADGNLGPMWVESLLSEGATVWGLGLNARQDSALAGLTQRYSALVIGDLDIAQPQSLKEITESLGVSGDKDRLDGVILNAGIDSIPGTGKTHLEEYDMAEWLRVFSVNVFGVVGILNSVLSLLSNPSSVVMLGSLYGLVSPNPALYSHFDGGKGSLKHPAYGASKAALLAVAKQYGTHLAPRGIRVNTLTLGGVEAGQDEQFVAKFKALVPQGRMLTKEELSGAMVFLLSDDSLAMTAQNVIVDGGFTSW